MAKGCVFACFLLCLVYLNADQDVDFDYYFGRGSLRYGDQECGYPDSKYLCHKNCPKNHVCFMKKCLCVEIDLNSIRQANKLRYPYKRSVRDEHNPPGFLDLTKNAQVENHDYPQKPALRHHIAHFCPNLDEARTCIRKCMKVGKPAFCGKDHVCYCGHKYGTTNPNEKVDVESVYSQFKDLYKKYFGEKFDQGFANSDEYEDQNHN